MKLDGNPTMDELHCQRLGRFDFNLPLFEIGKKSHKVTWQCGGNL
jgi:hypothetical protein